MLVVRATKKLLDRLGPVTLESGQTSTTRLGDWYASAWAWRPQVALFVSKATLFPILMPLAPAATLLARFPDGLAQALAAHDVPEAFITQELSRMQDVRLGKTASRSVLGIMNEFTFLAQTMRGDTTTDLTDLARWLARTPCSPLFKRHGSPDRELRALVDMLGYPVTNTLMGLGAYPASDRKFLGMLGMHGTIEANNAMQNCDVLLAVGARFDDRVIGNPKHFAQNERKIIHVDIDPSSISKRVKVDIPIVGDVKDVLTELISMIRESTVRPDAGALASWWSTIEEWRGKDCLKYDRGNKEVIKPQYVIETLWNMTKDADTYITSDVGQHQMWAAQYYRFDEPRRWINSGGLGTMGVGIPYAMGIKLAKPESEVFCVTGEGSVQMCIQELSTCLQYNTPIKICSLNNRYLGMVRQWQEIEYSGRYSHSYMDALPNFVKLAEAYGHVGLLIERPQDVEPALREARKLKDRTVFMDFRTDPTENVFPMVKAGMGITEMLLGSEDL